MIQRSSVAGRRTCYGCGTCAGVCPAGAIEMEQTGVGTYVPRVEPTLCTKCGLCLDVCPWERFALQRTLESCKDEEKVSLKCSPIGEFKGTYVGWACDDALCFQASSGGLVTAVLLFLLKYRYIDGALVTSLTADKRFRAKPYIARTATSIRAAIGSKYLPVAANTALREILEVPGRYAVVGLPCHMQGIARAEERLPVLSQRIVVRIGLACSGSFSMYGMQLLLTACKANVESVKSIRFRGRGWPGSFRVELSDGSSCTIPYSHYFTYLRWYLALGCFVCWDSLCEYADLSFGDAWMRDLRASGEDGVSIVVSRTNKGECIIQQAVKDGCASLLPISAQEIAESQSVNIGFKKRNQRLRLRFLALVSHEHPRFENIGKLEHRSLWYVIRTLLVFVRYLIITSPARLLVECILVRGLRIRTVREDALSPNR